MEQLIYSDREEILSFVKTKLAENFGQFGIELDIFDILNYSVSESQRESFEAIEERIRQELDHLKNELTENEKLISEINVKERQLKKQWVDGKVTQEQHDKQISRIEAVQNDYRAKNKEINKKINSIIVPQYRTNSN